ncbi:protein SGT1 homolog [Epargyreus clarus]|uniref:protein SGT1 homolog n=1 Tax=Epargyreus clarus TaxID=520877 RepID=UPI003C303C6B
MEVTATEPDKPKIKHDWYQTDALVVVTILLKNAPGDKVKVQYGERSLSVSSIIPNSDSEYSLELSLAHEIIPEMCMHVVSPSKIEVKLRKKEGLRWSLLEGEEQEASVKAIPQAVIDASGPPTQQLPKIYKKDWDKIEKDISKMDDEEPKGEAALNALFQKIYGEGSDEVRRAMNKSFMESGGTVLSTNWADVAAKKVTAQPPDGLEFKKWDS